MRGSKQALFAAGTKAWQCAALWLHMRCLLTLVYRIYQCLITNACSIKAWLHAPNQGPRPTKPERRATKAYLGRPLFSPLVNKTIDVV